MLIAEHVGLHDPTILFVLALIGLILAVVVLIQTRAHDLTAWAVGAVALALVIEWWP